MQQNARERARGRGLGKGHSGAVEFENVCGNYKVSEFTGERNGLRIIYITDKLLRGTTYIFFSILPSIPENVVLK